MRHAIAISYLVTKEQEIRIATYIAVLACVRAKKCRRANITRVRPRKILKKGARMQFTLCTYVCNEWSELFVQGSRFSNDYSTFLLLYVQLISSVDVFI